MNQYIINEIMDKSADMERLRLLCGNETLFKHFCDILTRNTLLCEGSFLFNKKVYDKKVSPMSARVSIYVACMDGNFELIELLLKLGLNNFESGLIGGCTSGHEDVVKMMIDKGAMDFGVGMKTACEEGYEGVVNLLIANMPPTVTNFTFDDKGTPFDQGLEGACISGNMMLAKLMISKGANHWNQGMLRSCENGHIRVVELMIEKAEEQHWVMLNYELGLQVACYGNHTEIINLMESKGANDWRKAFNSACLGGNMTIVNMTISKRTDIIDWNIGLQNACGNKEANQEVVNLMIANGANDWNGGLRGACYGGNYNFALLMISKGANDWNQGLSFACKDGENKLSKLMIERGATRCLSCDEDLEMHIEYDWE
jgi:ankyrin repeat protein